MPNCLASDQSGTGMKKKTLLLDQVQYRDKRTQSGTRMLRYRTEIQDVGMPMAAASASIPMPSYASSIFPNFFLIPFSYFLAPHIFLLLSFSLLSFSLYPFFNTSSSYPTFSHFSYNMSLPSAYPLYTLSTLLSQIFILLSFSSFPSLLVILSFF